MCVIIVVTKYTTQVPSVKVVGKIIISQSWVKRGSLHGLRLLSCNLFLVRDESSLATHILCRTTSLALYSPGVYIVSRLEHDTTFYVHIHISSCGLGLSLSVQISLNIWLRTSCLSFISLPRSPSPRLLYSVKFVPFRTVDSFIVQKVIPT